MNWYNDDGQCYRSQAPSMNSCGWTEKYHTGAWQDKTIPWPVFEQGPSQTQVNMLLLS